MEKGSYFTQRAWKKYGTVLTHTYTHSYPGIWKTIITNEKKKNPLVLTNIYFNIIILYLLESFKDIRGVLYTLYLAKITMAIIL